MSTETESVIITHTPMSPAAADAYRVFWETMGDNASWLETTEAQRKILDYAATEAVQDFIAKWEDPIPLFTNADLPTFPLAGMPPMLREMVEGLAEQAQVAVDLVAIIALAALSASLVGRVKVQPWGGWTEVVTLYSLGLAASGTRKTSIMDSLNIGLTEAEEQLRDMVRATRDEAIIKKSRAERRMLSTKKAAENKTATVEDEESYEEALREFNELEVPTLPSLVINDATPEALAHEMAANGNRLAVFDDEGDGLLTMAGVRYGNGSSNLGMLLKSHVGGQVRQSRMGREGTRIDNAVLSIGVLTQPQTLRQIIAVPGSEGRGLVDRFLIAAPPDRLGSRASVTEEVNSAIKAAFSHLLRSYAITLWACEDFMVLKLSEDGTSALQEFSQRVEDRLGEDGDLRALGGFGGKLVASAARLAALHHLAHYGPAAAFSVGINAASVQWGIAVAKWSVEHYTYAVQAVGGIGDVSDASRLRKWIANRQDKKAILQLREVQRLSPLRNHDQADAALKVLADHHWVRPAKEVRKGYSKDTKTWEVHPNLLA